MRSRWLISAFSRTLTLACSHPVHCRRFSSSATAAAATTAVAVKKVTKSNFEPALEDLRLRVREADFVAIDLEMTGITSAPWRDAFEFDRSDVRYLKVKDSAEKFAVVQFGVCPFRWDGAKGSFIAHPHNFYVFPRKELPVDGPSYEFLCQTTSIDFLAKYQFDFNACIHEGISYLSRAQEAEALQTLSSAYKDEFNNSLYNLEEHVEIPLLRTADLIFTERMKNRFHQWCDELIKSPAKNYRLEENSDSNKMQFQTVFFKMRPAVLLDGFSSHQLKLIRLVLRKHFKDLVYVRSVDENAMWKKIVVYTDSEEDKASLREVQEDLLRNTEARVRSAVGFRHVIDLLTSEEKLIVGHNCFLDIAHIYCKFFGPLPSSMVEFALAVHKNFPRIIDTRHLVNSSHVIQYLMKRSSKSLSSIFSLLCPRISSPSLHVASNSYVKVEVQADETGSSCFNSGAKHEAGYDAFMTGCVFAQACSHLGMKFELHSPSIDFSKNDKIQNYMNLLYPSWNSGTVIDLSTGIENPDSSYKRRYPQIVFSNIVLVWGFPSNIKPKDLKECVCKVFGPDSITLIFFVDSTAALIQFSKEDLVNEFLILKDNLESNDDPISVLHPLAKLLEGGNTHAANYETYRDICGSSISKVLFVDQAEAVGIRWKTKVENGSGETQKFASSSEITPGDNSPAVKQVIGKKNDPKRQSHHQVSCEDILDSLHASKLLFEKQVRSTR
ncbi:poly(A)-specific ribonuclease PARN-like isoform X2 [Phoenix dactylifera]|uniref:Poly(A)-specific ribonuclease PARN isoform X2 n=1 Tax=Phoenix dactylifera TaxID=42345 RepID=A0A8B7CYC9_PHODC|nr:poly(A)-specific ribonuclease PARN isoform X2 [Phoenix dactylifera]XP_038986218.1 poly(A)-specific ribonuclease PARN-like isoform X2 [Phoenix dactylifera]